MTSKSTVSNFKILLRSGYPPTIFNAGIRDMELAMVVPERSQL